LRVDGWTFDTVAGKRFGDELNQIVHLGAPGTANNPSRIGQQPLRLAVL
jgi:hypothetical protein